MLLTRMELSVVRDGTGNLMSWPRDCNGLGTGLDAEWPKDSGKIVHSLKVFDFLADGWA